MGGGEHRRFPGIAGGADSGMRADGVEIGRDDMIGAFRQADDIARLAFGVDEFAKRISVLRHIDRQRQFGRVDRRVGERALDPERARRNSQSFGANSRAERQAFGRAGEPESDMNDIIAGRYGQGRLGETRFDDQGMRAVRIGLRAEYPPSQTARRAACRRR